MISVSDKIMVPFLLMCLQLLCLNRKEEVLQCDDVSFDNDMAKCVKSDRKSNYKCFMKLLKERLLGRKVKTVQNWAFQCSLVGLIEPICEIYNIRSLTGIDLR